MGDARRECRDATTYVNGAPFVTLQMTALVPERRARNMSAPCIRPSGEMPFAGWGCERSTTVRVRGTASRCRLPEVCTRGTKQFTTSSFGPSIDHRMPVDPTRGYEAW